jgi:hypothetical protein
VGMEEISFAGGSGVAHLLQKRLLSGFTEWHLGHSIPIFVDCVAKEYQFMKKESIGDVPILLSCF